MIRRFKTWLCHWLCRDLIWNRDISLENDALRIQVERLREIIKELEGRL